MGRKHYPLLRMALYFTHRPRVDPSQRLFSRILAISTTAVGDTLLSTPGFSALRRLNPQAKIVALIRDRYASMFLSNPDLDGVIPYKKGWLGFIRCLNLLNKENFDAAFLFHASDPGPVSLAALAGIPFIAGKSLLPPFDHLFTLFTRPDYNLHTIERRLEIFKRMYPEFSDWPRRLVLPLNKTETSQALRKFEKFLGAPLSDKTVVGLQPGASRVFKMWPKERFIELGRKLLDSNPHLILVILGNASENSLGKALLDGINAPERVFSLCGKTRIEELPAIISSLDYLITNDTGTLHVAIAVGTPTISLFAATDPISSGPYQDLDRHFVISKPRPCGKNCVHKKCPLKPSCMTLISVEEVYEKARQMPPKSGQALSLKNQ